MVKTDDILKKYGSKIESQMRGYNKSVKKKKFGNSYSDFRKSMSPDLSSYEKWCKSLGGLFKVKVSEKESASLNKYIDIAHLNVTPSEVLVLSLVGMFLSLFVGALLLVGVYFITDVFSLMFLFSVFIFAVIFFFYLSKYPATLAMKWRLKASSQMVPAILYIVIYMKHTSNFEKAVSFAAEHLENPLAADFRKVFWDVEVGKFSTIKDSVDNYLESWREYSLEFIEAFHLIESSLFEPNEGRRIDILEKSLQVILDGVYDKMLKYTHEAKSPLTNVYMLGIVLPTLALAILPLASAMMGGSIRWYHVAFLFNLIIPFLVVYLTTNVMMKRPGGYGSSDLLKSNPLYSKYVSKKPYFIGLIYSIPFFIIGLFPLIWMYSPLHTWLGMSLDYTWAEVGLGFLGNSSLFGIISDGAGGFVGPFGTLSLVLSLFVPLGVAVFFIIAYGRRTKELIKERAKYKDVEKEFTSSLFQLGNRLGDGTPAEAAFGKILDSTKGTATEGFFRVVNENIQNLGMGLNRALFDPVRGAVIYYPSNLIATSMKILVESAKKGLSVAANSLMSISDYVKNINKVNARLNDLLADIISDMKSNMTFLAPLLSGIIVGLSGMIALILMNLKVMMDSFSGGDIGGVGNIGNLMSVLNVQEMIPTYWLQLIIGIYLVQIVFILTSTLVTVKSGKDDLEELYETGRSLKRTLAIYSVIAFLSIVGLSLIGAVALKGLVG